MNSFQCNTQTVLQYLMDMGGKTTYYWLAHSCFNQLDGFLAINKLSYSSDHSQRWLKTQSKSEKVLKSYSKALRQLQDVYDVGHVRFVNRSGINLYGTYEEVISKYISDVSGKYSAVHLRSIRSRCRFFFGFVQMDRDRTSPAELTYPDILTFNNEALKCLCKADYGMYKGTVAAFLLWMADHGLCSKGFSVLLSLEKVEKAVMIDALPENARCKIKCIESQSNSAILPEEMFDLSKDFCVRLKEFGYRETMMNSAKATLRMLFLFLDMNGLHYDPALAWNWFRIRGTECFGSNDKMSRRVLSLFECFVKEGNVHPENTFVYSPLLSD